MKYILLMMVFASRSALADSGQGGMAECLSQSLGAALKVYSQSQSLNPVPAISISKSNRSPSNGGADVIVTISGKEYFVIGQTNFERNADGVPVKLLGCSGAMVVK